MASPPGPITGVDFVTVPTNDFEAAVGFYGTTLGLPCSVKIPERHYAEFEAGPRPSAWSWPRTSPSATTPTSTR
jgi:catechol 2,3-dioxygenase-like lactoylglutathione lyase family enzyme